MKIGGSMKKQLTFYQLFWIFFIGCIFGWLVEVLYDLVLLGKFVNHSSLIYGPIGGAYGIGAVLIAWFLNKFEGSSYLKIFLVSFALGTIGEYIMSWGMELVLGFTAWDYSHLFLNINGRVCLLYSLFWGVLGILWVKWIMPFLEKTINKLPLKIGKVMMYLLIIFLVFDIAISYMAVARQKQRASSIQPQNKWEEFLDKHYTDEFLEKNISRHSKCE